MIPNDPFFARQWHFNLIGDIRSVWDEYTGTEVLVGVYDTGVELAHPDLIDRHDPRGNVLVHGENRSGEVANRGGHGTAVAGLIVASGNNGIGVTGVAWGASFGSVNIFDSTKPEFNRFSNEYIDVTRQSTNFDIVNNSWSFDYGYRNYYNLNNPDSFVGKVVDAYETVAENGRNGLGTIIIKSSGNLNLDINAENVSSFRCTISVAGTKEDGFTTWYSGFGSSLLITAPSGESTAGQRTIVTTDLTGTGGYNTKTTADGFDGTGNYVDNQFGTSFAAPIVSGVVALMLDANPALGWRDVQNILAYSAHHTGRAIGSSATGTNENGAWQLNGAENWNGGGAHFSIDYGYGMVNAYNAVRMAEAWNIFSPESQASSNEKQFEYEVAGLGIAINDLSTARYQFDVAEQIELENIALTLNIQHAKFEDLVIYFVSPEGTRYESYCLGDQAESGLTWTWGFKGYRGEVSAGTWTLEIRDRAASNQGVLNSLRMEGYGSAASLDDVYHYTDEYSETVALAGQGGRAVLSDTDGGVDWIEAAAVRTNSTVNLKDGTATIDGVALTVSGIENVLTGDGNDDLTGDDGSNRLVGMRGNDTLRGGNGNDILEGGAGADRLFGDDGIDTISYEHAKGGVTVDIDRSSENAGDAAGDLYANVENILGSAFDDTLRGAAENNRIVGGAGSDRLAGKGGDDVLLGGVGGDWLDGGEGVDTISYENAATGVTVDIDRSADNTGEAAGDGFVDVENILGSAFDDILSGAAESNRIDGAAGADTMAGRGGDDTYLVDNVGDRVFEVSGGGRDAVATSVSYSLAAGQEIEELRIVLAAGALAINLTGNAFAQTLRGNAAANVLNGGAGADILIGGAGNDTYLIDDAGDRVTEARGGGTDAIATTVTYALAAGQEVEELRVAQSVGDRAVKLTGNEFAQTLKGNGGANTLDGKAGADTLIGGGGNDTYLVDNAGDRVVEAAGGGRDAVATTVTYILAAGQEIEELRIAGVAGDRAINLTGNAVAQTLIGNDGANILNGAFGNDVLTGQGGADIFVFANGLGSTNIDRITDFASEDTIQLSKSIFKALTLGELDAGAFKNISIGTADAEDRILYKQETGEVFYDPDGSGRTAAVKFAVLDNKLALTSADFLVV